MYAYLTKGFTVGSVLTMRLLRNITALPGMAIDAFMSLFWPEYAEDTEGVTYLDDTPVGLFAGIFGYTGELTGLIVGPIIGLAAGFAVYAVDSALRLTRALQLSVYSGFSSIAAYIGSSSFFAEFAVYENPVSFRQKAWNIGAAFIGGILAVVPYTAARLMEFFIPDLEDILSSSVTFVFGYLAGFMSATLAMPLWPVAYAINRTGDLYEIAAGKFRNLIAIIYAKTGEEPGADDFCDGDFHDCIPAELMHSDEFLREVEAAKKTPWDQLLFGPSKRDLPVAEAVVEHDPDHIDCTTNEKLGINGLSVVVDPCGHRFNNYVHGESKGINFWLNNHNSCPKGKEALNAGNLVSDEAYNEVLDLGF